MGGVDHGLVKQVEAGHRGAAPGAEGFGQVGIGELCEDANGPVEILGEILHGGCLAGVVFGRGGRTAFTELAEIVAFRLAEVLQFAAEGAGVGKRFVIVILGGHGFGDLEGEVFRLAPVAGQDFNFLVFAARLGVAGDTGCGGRGRSCNHFGYDFATIHPFAPRTIVVTFPCAGQ